MTKHSKLIAHIEDQMDEPTRKSPDEVDWEKGIGVALTYHEAKLFVSLLIQDREKDVNNS